MPNPNNTSVITDDLNDALVRLREYMTRENARQMEENLQREMRRRETSMLHDAEAIERGQQLHRTMEATMAAVPPAPEMPASIPLIAPEPFGRSIRFSESTARNGALSDELYETAFRRVNFSRYLSDEPTSSGAAIPAPTPNPEAGYYDCQMMEVLPLQDDGRRYPGWQRKSRLNLPMLDYRARQRVAVIGVTKLPPGGKALVSQVLNTMRLNYDAVEFRTGPCPGTDAVVREFSTGYNLTWQQFGDSNPMEPTYTVRSHRMLDRANAVIGFRVEDDAVPLPRGYRSLIRRARAQNIPVQEYILPCDASTTIAPA